MQNVLVEAQGWELFQSRYSSPQCLAAPKNLGTNVSENLKPGLAS